MNSGDLEGWAVPALLGPFALFYTLFTNTVVCHEWERIGACFRQVEHVLVTRTFIIYMYVKRYTPMNCNRSTVKLSILRAWVCVRKSSLWSIQITSTDISYIRNWSKVQIIQYSNIFRIQIRQVSVNLRECLESMKYFNPKVCHWFKLCH